MKVRRSVKAILIILLFTLSFTISFGLTFTCIAGGPPFSCSGIDVFFSGEFATLSNLPINQISDAFNMIDNAILSAVKNGITDSFHFIESSSINLANTMLNDLFHMTDTLKMNAHTFSLIDSRHFIEASRLTCKCNVPATTTITQISVSTTNPFVNNNTPFDTILTTVIVPALIFFLVILVGYWIGLTKASLVIGLVFIMIFGLAKIGIFPSYFTLIGIIFVSGILTLLLARFFRGNSGSNE